MGVDALVVIEDLFHILTIFLKEEMCKIEGVTKAGEGILIEENLVELK